MNYTENYQLNQWESIDRVLREDFNADNQKIENVIAALQSSALQIAVGSYSGTGSASYNGNTTQDIAVGFPPKAVFVSRNSYFADGSGAFLTTSKQLVYENGSQYYVYGQLTDNGFTVGTAYVSGNTLYPDLNTLNQTYHYLAIG